MSVLKCKMCGAPLNYNGVSTVVECEYCFSQQTVPKLDDEKKLALYDRANYYRSKKEFDRACFVYESIISESPNEAEAHWGVCLCRYGIEYVVDPKNEKRIPTCHRTQFKSILEDEDYLLAIKNADILSRGIYETEAQYIDSVQKGILEISSKEEPFDIFICYKETDDLGERTLDSVLAQEIYDALIQKGHKVFFSRITLEDKLGTAYEPYIFAALNSARIMLVVGTKPENFEAIWVKNEWSRYLALMGENQNKVLIPCYRNISPYEMPEVFTTLQAQDMSKLGWLQDLTRGVDKVLGKASVVPKAENKPMFDVEKSLNALKNCIKSKDWEMAKRLSKKLINVEPENPDVHYYAFLAEFKIKNIDELKIDSESDLLNNIFFKRMLRYSDKNRREEVQNYIDSWRREEEYNNAKIALGHRRYKEAAKKFENLGSYKDSVIYAKRARGLRQYESEIGNSERDYIKNRIRTLYPTEFDQYMNIKGKQDKNSSYVIHSAPYTIACILMPLIPLLYSLLEERTLFIWGIALAFLIYEWNLVVVVDFGDFVKAAGIAVVSGIGSILTFYQLVTLFDEESIALFIFSALGLVFLISNISGYIKKRRYDNYKVMTQEQYKNFILPAVKSIKDELMKKYSGDIGDIYTLVNRLSFEQLKP